MALHPWICDDGVTKPDVPSDRLDASAFTRLKAWRSHLVGV
jgi:hypothetical protein